MIDIIGIKKSFGKLEVLKGIDLSIDSGQVLAVLGPNGSGKTTILKVLLGLVIPDSGTIFFNGEEIKGQIDYRKEIGYLSQITHFPENLQVRELIAMIQDLRGEKGDPQSLINRFALNEYMNKKLRYLSGGTKQKVNLVLTFMYDCPVYILDEPTSGLDPIALIGLKDLIEEEKKKGKTFILTTHIMSLVDELADSMVFLMDGLVYFQGSTDRLIKQQREQNLERAIAKIIGDYDA